MAISHSDAGQLCIYRIGNGASVLLHTVGRFAGGAGPKHFSYPFKMCSAPDGNVLVCENGNNRIQELTALCDTEPSFVRFIKADGARSVALRDDKLAVGTVTGHILICSYATGALIRKIGGAGTRAGEIGTFCHGLRFTHDGSSVIVAEHSNNRLSMFNAIAGDFERHIGTLHTEIISNGTKDVEIAPNGDVIVTDLIKHRVRVFSAAMDLASSRWLGPTPASGPAVLLRSPSALALVGNTLYVLEAGSGRVHVFR